MTPEGPQEQRRAPRYVPSVALQAEFGSAVVNIQNLCATGFQIAHMESVPLGEARTLRFVYPRSFDPLHREVGIGARDPESNYREFRCATVWSRFGSSMTGAAGYTSGLRVTSNTMEALLLPQLMREILQPDVASLLRRHQYWGERRERWMKAQELSDKVFLARTAAEHLRTHREIAHIWHRRARHVLSYHLSGRVNPAVGYTPEVVAVWEFLGRSLPLHTIAHALEARMD
jgi:hypothetical protein